METLARMHALRRYRVGLALVVLAVIVGVLVFYRLKDQQARAVQRPRGDTLVGVVTPVRKDLEVRFGTTADILANQQAAIFSKVSGYIRRIHVDRGDFVKEGQLLVEIDDQELRAQLGGQTVQQREAFGSLKFTTLLALVLVYMVMASQFRSLLDPFLIMFSVSLGMMGVIWALFLTNTTLNVTSFMGIIMMVGIVVSNGVLLVEYINELRRHGQALIPAVINGGRTRLRPILMTSLTTLVGLMPMALGIDVGSEANAPLARAVIGGLAVSTVLTLILIPTLYVMVESRFPRRVEDPHPAFTPQGETA
jgi:Cu/Ag efflux pump CusA